LGLVAAAAPEEAVKSPFLGLAISALASMNLNVGKGIQKWKVKIFAKGKAMFAPENRRDLIIWLIGLGLTASGVPLFSFALKLTDKSSQVSALNGVGLFGLVAFALIVLKEKIGWQEIGGAACIIGGTAIVHLFDRPAAEQTYSAMGFLISFSVLLGVFLALAAFAWKTGKIYGFAFGAIPGIFIGSALILADIALVKAGGDMIGQLGNIYAWIAVIFGVLATVSSQFAFWRGRAMVVIPTTNSFVILAPVVIQYFTFGTMLRPIQYLAIGVIIAGVILLTSTEALAATEAKPEA
jgi:drug/metabolite transporter (DMT)-like permease